MSDKIKSKDLSYDAALPPFLQRLRGQHTGRDGDPDRHEREIARPRKAKVANNEDEPTIVDEHGDLVTHAELQKQAAELESKAVQQSIDEQTAQHEAAKALTKESAAAGVLTKKRKIAKVVGGDNDETPEDNHPVSGKKTVNAAKKKKVKPIKLAFDDDEND